ncbi:MAG TPA: flagellar biosynthesis protein FlhB [Chloroflexi bacterium]|nr:flagellar biosynthesis protein FlhB [Chloroflexota bacterium]
MSERTEAPTPRKLQEAREQGQVARSQELNAAASLLVGILLLGGPGRMLVLNLQNSLSEMLSIIPSIPISNPSLADISLSVLLPILPSFGTILFGLLFTGVAVTIAQTGLLWSSKRLTPDLSRLNPIQGLKGLISGRGLFELGKALLKLGIAGWVAYSFLRSNGGALIALGGMDFRAALAQCTTLARSLALRIASVYLILAIGDYAYQKWHYKRSLRMTKEEVKEDLKRSEGDPLLRQRVRSQQRRLARQRMMANVPKADVIITNPTHLAVAVRYQAEIMQAPRVIAKGAYRIADRIVALAKQHHIPIVQNIPLARALYRSVAVEEEISPDLYLAMAEVLAYVYRLRATNRGLPAHSQSSPNRPRVGGNPRARGGSVQEIKREAAY